jgi:ornithine cyclodeaminase/alanine dehydrogenase-like protein (mu-crystallin family)
MTAPIIGRQILHLSRADVVACGVTPARMNAVVEAVFLAEAQGTAWTQPKLALFRPDGSSFRAKAGALTHPGYGAVKWFGYFPGNADRGLPDFWPMILLNEADTGFPVAMMDASWITATRTASITAAGAKHMARRSATRVGFVACGTQARSNLDALAAAFPLRHVTAYSRNPETAASFTAAARTGGFAAEAVTDPRDAVRGQDIVVTSVPHASTSSRFLDAADVSPGAFVSMVDLGFGWRKETLGAFDRVVTDNMAQSGPGGSEKLNFDGTYAGDLADVIGGRIPGRISAEERNALIFAGTGHVDAAAAIEVFEAACARGIGTLLPL